MRPCPAPTARPRHAPARAATAAFTLASAVATAAIWPALPCAAAAAAPLPDCLGERQPLTVASQMPYALVSVAGRQGYMVLDFGASVSSITPAAFQGDSPPQPADPWNNASTNAGTQRWNDFVFFGTWGTVQLLHQPRPAVQALRSADGAAALQQAGVIGTDFLARHIYTLDYRGGHLWRAGAGSFCADAVLRAAGWRPVSTADYYGPQPGQLSCPRAGAAPGGCVNIPSVPLRIGRVQAVAQLDTGHDDSRQPGAVNINAALFDALRAAGVKLVARPDIALQLSTCVSGVSERVEAWRLAPGTPFGLVDTSARLLPRPRGEVTLFVKRTPPAAAVCGGIGTWAQPAAQLGASFVAGGTLVVDPFTARIWLR